ncbi:DNA-binding SARP family transcriptional activator [Actinomadura pelletieri DSM 43383]|uniref:DNA-binding SARP family transcriptional activator n=1 Tax=Actinomadura pelletieri DSM 43383 TaxID=1120940 RepID=A0A495QMW0_9ACTN|nr:macro domain-containing protein [Actinomadura pelletieri]RKS74318.1 DNA-binding SARP family transcriptional activator [Actinomadura pelletieri DSM 43383]
MTRIHVGVLGPAVLSVGGHEVGLAPLTVKLLVRLVAAEGEAVSAMRLYRDVWNEPAAADTGATGRLHRTEVQKRILELRRALGRDEAARVLLTEQVLNGRGTESAYRLVLASDQLDCAEFGERVNRAAHAAPATAAALLTRALELWRGRPLPEASGAEFARTMTRRLTAQYDTARRELVRVHLELGHLDAALPLAERLAEERPDDEEATGPLRTIRKRLRARHGDEVLRREFSGLRVAVTVKRGDVFAEDDANLVVGFGDTFDTDTTDDFVISRESVQGQLLHRVYGGDRELLDKELRRGLRRVAPTGRDSPRDKPRGKRLRYPIGTVVSLPLSGRRVFATVHCRQGFDLATTSTPEDLRTGLERLWESVDVHGLRKPVATPLLGAGFARLDALDREQIMMLIIVTYLRACRVRRVAPELRIVLRPEDLAHVRLADVARFVEALDSDGVAPEEDL